MPIYNNPDASKARNSCGQEHGWVGGWEVNERTAELQCELKKRLRMCVCCRKMAEKSRRETGRGKGCYGRGARMCARVHVDTR